MFRAVRDTGAFHLDDPTFSTNPVRARFPWRKEKPRKDVRGPSCRPGSQRSTACPTGSVVTSSGPSTSADSAIWPPALSAGSIEPGPHAHRRGRCRSSAHQHPPAQTDGGRTARSRRRYRRQWLNRSIAGAKQTACCTAVIASPHRLRRTGSAGHDLCIPRLVVKILMNHVRTHAHPTNGQHNSGDETLREAAGKIAGFLIGKTGAKPATTPNTRQTAGRLVAAQPRRAGFGGMTQPRESASRLPRRMVRNLSPRGATG